MYCSNCGTQNTDGVSFCSTCGAPLLQPVQEVQPIQESVQQPIIQTVYLKPKTNKLSLVGFILSLCGLITFCLSCIPGLICSIIGLIQCSKKKENGKGYAITGIIISSILIFLCIGFWNTLANITNRTYPGYNDYDHDYDYTEYTTTEWTTRATTEETTEETTRATTRETTTETTTEPTTTTTEDIIPSSSESKKGYTITSVGNAKTGTVTLDKGNWVNFIEAGGFGKETVEHAQAKDLTGGSIIGLFVLDVPYSLEDLTKSQMAVMEQNGGIQVTGAKVKLGGYDAYQCYCLFPDGQYLVCWYFKGNDGMIRKVTVEFTEANYYAFELVQNNYKLD